MDFIAHAFMGFAESIARRGTGSPGNIHPVGFPCGAGF
jgi:hypothetical protein